MDYDPLNIKDSDPRTEGGPPGWIAWTVILLSVTTIAIVALVAGVLF